MKQASHRFFECLAGAVSHHAFALIVSALLSQAELSFLPSLACVFPAHSPAALHQPQYSPARHSAQLQAEHIAAGLASGPSLSDFYDGPC